MSHFIIRGGNLLSGSIPVYGAKNHALKMFPASILCKKPVILENVPCIEDVFRTSELLKSLGFGVERRGKQAYHVIPPPSGVLATALQRDIAECIRASILFVGPLLARAGSAQFPFPGGCVIGRRPVDLFLDGWKAMGATIRETAGMFTIRAGALHGIDLRFAL
jgi:UDP-N-acetylglucosamine 1-carboxyvinyltransferase